MCIGSRKRSAHACSPSIEGALDIQRIASTLPIPGRMIVPPPRITSPASCAAVPAEGTCRLAVPSTAVVFGGTSTGRKVSTSTSGSEGLTPGLRTDTSVTNAERTIAAPSFEDGQTLFQVVRAPSSANRSVSTGSGPCAG